MSGHTQITTSGSPPRTVTETGQKTLDQVLHAQLREQGRVRDGDPPALLQTLRDDLLFGRLMEIRQFLGHYPTLREALDHFAVPDCGECGQFLAALSRPPSAADPTHLNAVARTLEGLLRHLPQHGVDPDCLGDCMTEVLDAVSHGSRVRKLLTYLAEDGCRECRQLLGEPLTPSGRDRAQLMAAAEAVRRLQRHLPEHGYDPDKLRAICPDPEKQITCARLDFRLWSLTPGAREVVEALGGGLSRRLREYDAAAAAWEQSVRKRARGVVNRAAVSPGEWDEAQEHVHAETVRKVLQEVGRGKFRWASRLSTFQHTLMQRSLQEWLRARSSPLKALVALKYWEEHLADVSTLLFSIRRQNDPVSRELFQREEWGKARPDLERFEGRSEVSPQLRAALVATLNGVLHDPGLIERIPGPLDGYAADENCVRVQPLTDADKLAIRRRSNTLGARPSRTSLERRNRWLLEHYYTEQVFRPMAEQAGPRHFQGGNPLLSLDGLTRGGDGEAEGSGSVEPPDPASLSTIDELMLRNSIRALLGDSLDGRAFDLVWECCRETGRLPNSQACDEMAEELGCPAGAVRAAVARFRAALREFLRDEGDQGGPRTRQPRRRVSQAR